MLCAKYLSISIQEARPDSNPLVAQQSVLLVPLVRIINRVFKHQAFPRPYRLYNTRPMTLTALLVLMVSRHSDQWHLTTTTKFLIPVLFEGGRMSVLLGTQGLLMPS